VLQHTKTHCFFQEGGSWTPDVKAAADFGGSQRALDFVRENSLTDVLVMVTFLKGAYLESVVLPPDHPVPPPERTVPPRARA